MERVRTESLRRPTEAESERAGEPPITTSEEPRRDLGMASSGAARLVMWGGVKASPQAPMAKRGAEVAPEPGLHAERAACVAGVAVCMVCGGSGQGRAPRKWTSTRRCRARGVCPRCHGAGGVPLPPPSVDLRWIKFTAKAKAEAPGGHDAPPTT